MFLTNMSLKLLQVREIMTFTILALTNWTFEGAWLHKFMLRVSGIGPAPPIVNRAVNMVLGGYFT